jgi:hypothetical protein
MSSKIGHPIGVLGHPAGGSNWRSKIGAYLRLADVPSLGRSNWTPTIMGPIGPPIGVLGPIGPPVGAPWFRWTILVQPDVVLCVVLSSSCVVWLCVYAGGREALTAITGVL